MGNSVYSFIFMHSGGEIHETILIYRPTLRNFIYVHAYNKKFDLCTRNYIYVQASIKKLYFMYWPTLRNYIYRGTGVHQKNYIYVQACFKKYIYVQDPSRNYTYVQAYIKKLYFMYWPT